MFFETTIMGTLLTWQWSRRRTLTPSTKRVSHSRSLLKGVAVYRVLYQSILNAKLTGRKNLGRKRCTSNRDDRKLENTVKQSWFKHLWERHKEWTEAGVSASRVTTLRHLQEKGYQATSEPLLFRQRQKHLTWAVEKKNWTVARWSKVLFSDESKFCISFGNQGPRVWRKSGEAQNPCCLKSSVKFPQSVMIWAAMSSAGVGPLCFLKSTVNAAIYQEILEHFMLPSADKLYGDADFIFQQDLAPAHTAKGTKSWFNDHGVTVLDWPANSPDLNVLSRGDERHQTQQCRWPEGHCQRNLGFHTTSAVPTNWSPPCHAVSSQLKEPKT